MSRPIYTSEPKAQYLALRTEIDAAIRSVLDGPAYVLGEAVSEFERDFAAYCGAAHGIGVNNGTDAIHLALRGLGIGAGDEVITVSHTAVATVAAVEMAGAVPVLADVDPGTRTMDPLDVEKRITARTKAILAVHLYGHPFDLDALREICDRRSLFLIEDCAQAHGAKWNGQRIGSFGHAATFSFYPTKNLGAIGDAGMVITNDPALAHRIGLLRQYGWEQPQYSILRGWNSRLDPLQAAILATKLRHLDHGTQQRRALARRYHDRLQRLPLKLPFVHPNAEHVYHLYVIELNSQQERDALRAFLAEASIHAGIHYPFPVHLQPAYQHLKHAPLPVTEQLSRTVLSLPLYPELSDVDQQRVIDRVLAFFDRKK